MTSRLPEDLRNQARTLSPAIKERLEGLVGPSSDAEPIVISPDGKLDILWGWKETAAALGVDVDTAKHLAQEEGLPVFRDGKKAVQTTRQALQVWANNRATGRHLN